MSRTFRDIRRIEERQFWKQVRQVNKLTGWRANGCWDALRDESWRIRPWTKGYWRSLKGETRNHYHLLQVEILEETGYLVQWRHRRGGYMDESDKVKDFHK